MHQNTLIIILKKVTYDNSIILLYPIE